MPTYVESANPREAQLGCVYQSDQTAERAAAERRGDTFKARRRTWKRRGGFLPCFRMMRPINGVRYNNLLVNTLLVIHRKGFKITARKLS